MPNKLFAEYSDEEFEKEFSMEKTSENVNWMYAVRSINNGTNDLIGLLQDLDDNYSGVIDLHEGYGGIEADSNQEIISEIIEFDLREALEHHNAEATLEAIRLNWINFSLEEYQELVAEEEAE